MCVEALKVVGLDVAQGIAVRIPVQADRDRDTKGVADDFGEIHSKVAGLVVCQATWDGDSVITGDLRVFSMLGRFDAVPELLGVGRPSRDTFGRHGDRTDNLLPGPPFPEIVGLAGALIRQLQPETVGGARHGRMDLGPVVGGQVRAGMFRGGGTGGLGHGLPWLGAPFMALGILSLHQSRGWPPVKRLDVQMNRQDQRGASCPSPKERGAGSMAPLL